MIRWVVTGPAGAGKSFFCRMLAELGAAVVDGDRLGHDVLAQPATVARIAAAFGPAVVVAGAVDRPALGEIVFGDSEAMGQLNRITHGSLVALMSDRLDELERTGRYRLAVLDAAVYFLLPPVPGIELTVTVTAPEAVRRERLVRHQGLTDRQATARIVAQRSMAAAWDRADVVLINDGSVADLERAAHRLWERLGE